MDAKGRRSGVALRVFVGAMALLHIAAGLGAPIALLGLVAKVLGVEGNPLDISGHPGIRRPSEQEIWATLAYWSLMLCLFLAYGVCLAAPAIKTPVGAPKTARRARGLAIACTATLGCFLGWVFVTTFASERDAALVALVVGLGYAAANTVVFVILRRDIAGAMDERSAARRG